MIRNGGQSVLEFKYNADGIRTSKTVNGTEHVYTLNGSQIVSEAWLDRLLIYLYDESGSPIGMQYRTSSYAADAFDTFYFEKNLQGDIIAIYTESGRKILEYTYDAWGNHSITWTYLTMETLPAGTNPFRYRGYYYDTDTQLYYLQSRYYNPQWGRFLNADGYINANGDLIGFNMYAYCSNNPVNGYDPIGKWTISAGYNISAFLVGGFTWSINLSFDSSGNIAIQTTKANVFEKQSGAIIGPAAAGVSKTFSITGYDTVDDLEGIFYNVGVPVASNSPASVEAELNFSSDGDFAGVTVSGSVGAGVDIHASATNTETVVKFNPVEWIKSVWKKIKGVFT